MIKKLIRLIANPATFRIQAIYEVVYDDCDVYMIDTETGRVMGGRIPFSRQEEEDTSHGSERQYHFHLSRLKGLLEAPTKKE